MSTLARRVSTLASLKQYSMKSNDLDNQLYSFWHVAQRGEQARESEREAEREEERKREREKNIIMRNTSEREINGEREGRETETERERERQRGEPEPE